MFHNLNFAFLRENSNWFLDRNWTFGLEGSLPSQWNFSGRTNQKMTHCEVTLFLTYIFWKLSFWHFFLERVLSAFITITVLSLHHSSECWKKVALLHQNSNWRFSKYVFVMSWIWIFAFESWKFMRYFCPFANNVTCHDNPIFENFAIFVPFSC